LEVVIKESPIFVKTYDFTKWLLEHTIKFPKSQRFVMAKRMEDALLKVDASVQSWIGQARQADTYGLRREIFGNIIFLPARGKMAGELGGCSAPKK
jgi:hypothetical protein